MKNNRVSIVNMNNKVIMITLILVKLD